MRADAFSDYGSGNSINSTHSWNGKEPSQSKTGLDMKRTSSSFLDMMKQCTLEDSLQEFRRNGFDSPYNPDEERRSNRHAEHLVGMGPSSQYLRQKSWPQPDSTPAVQLPKPRLDQDWAASVEPKPRLNQDWAANLEQEYLPRPTQSAEVPKEVPPQYAISQPEAMTAEQLRLLWSLPNDVLYSLLRELGRGDRPAGRRVNEVRLECRFCKNNGERESYYRTHALKAAGRVTCPVLRAFVCRRCGASGDSAHTAKYCPLATSDERKKSAAMMRSVRLASGRRRASSELVHFGSASRSVLEDNQAYANYLNTPLDPLWAALEQKLML